jgi:hypothetical protein
MSVDSAYGSKGWEFESLRARLGNLNDRSELCRGREVRLHRIAALLIALKRSGLSLSGLVLHH